MVIFAVLTVKNSEKQSNSKDDHRCTNRHMSTQSPPNTQSSLLKRALYGGITVTHSSLSAKKWSNDWVGLVFCEANTFVCSYKKLVSKWDKRTLPPKPRHRSKTICKKNLHVLPDLPTLPQSYLKVETLASGFACEQRYDSWSQETCLPLTRRLKPRDPINICLHMLPVCDSQTDGQTDRQTKCFPSWTPNYVDVASTISPPQRSAAAAAHVLAIFRPTMWHYYRVLAKLTRA